MKFFKNVLVNFSWQVTPKGIS